MNFKGKLIGGLAIAAAVLLAVAALSYLGQARNIDDRKWVTHTHLVLERIDDVQGDMIDAETGQRGYLITADDAYLEPYNNALHRLAEDTSELGELTKDNASQQNAMSRLMPMIASKLAYLQGRIDLLQKKGAPRARASLKEGAGKESMDQIRAVLASMKGTEKTLLAGRSKDLEASSRTTKLSIVMGDSLGFVFLLGAGLIIQQEMRHRSLIEEEVRKLNAELECRVAERTAELAERAKDLERSNQELQQFAYVASHDLQEPLRTISSFTQLLAKRYGDKLDDRAGEFINFAVDGCKRMQTLINDLLAFSRVGTQGKPLARTDSGAVLDRVLKNLRIAIQESGAVITKGVLPAVLVDEGQLGQLFQNLIGNALKFRGKDTPRIHIAAERAGMEWKIAVRDNGIGIAPEHNDRIFVIFQRLHTKAQYPGTGIGLAICKKIAERHGGRIWVEPQPDGGSTFCFTIPDGGQNAYQGEDHELRVGSAAD